MTEAYPLYWPEGYPRTPASKRESGRFGRAEMVKSPYSDRYHREKKDLTVAVARDRLQRELDMLAAAYIVLSTNLELRLDGSPRSSQREPDDPGVACYFRLRGKPVVLPCDRYLTVAANIAAIASHIDATRAIERHGVGTLEQMFAGFTALPAPDDWRAALDNPASLAEAQAVYRRKMRDAHPDAGGSHAAAAALNAAIERARREIGGG